jgi:hypothetical protein
MQFRLTYEGQLYGANRTTGRADHKHELRRHFHEQLRVLWKRHPGLKMLSASGDLKYSFPEFAPMVAWLAERYVRGDYAFVPLVCETSSVYCSLDILLLRPELPGTLIESGDLDNRLKTLVDALRVPCTAAEMGKVGAPSESERPFFCLLEDDKLISRFTVEADTLLSLPPDHADHPENNVRLVITVEIKPYRLQTGNLHF